MPKSLSVFEILTHWPFFTQEVCHVSLRFHYPLFRFSELITLENVAGSVKMEKLLWFQQECCTTYKRYFSHIGPNGFYNGHNETALIRFLQMISASAATDLSRMHAQYYRLFMNPQDFSGVNPCSFGGPCIFCNTRA